MDRPAPSSEVVILVGRRATAVRLLDVYRDWAALRLLRPVLIVDADSLRIDDLTVPCVAITGEGHASALSLQEHLAEMLGVQRVRICAVGEVAATYVSADLAEASAVATAVRGARPGVQVTQVRVVGMALQGATPPQDLAWLGWHNVVLAPENSAAPSGGVAPILVGEDDTLRRTHLAGSIASLVALWVNQDGCPLDDRALLPDQMLVAARSFSRQLSAVEVESRLLGNLSDVTDGYPTPQYDGRSTWVVEDEAAAGRDMANALLAQHSYVLPRTREMPRPTPPRPIGALESLRMLFSFLGSALRNAPRAFLDAAVNRVSAGTASVAGRFVFGGGPSDFEVVVNGVKSDGSPASWDEIDAALSASVERWGVPTTHRAAADLSGLWRDYVAGGLTLLDSGVRVKELAPLVTGSHRAVISRPERVVPAPTDHYAASATVSAFLSGWTVHPVDVLSARLLGDELTKLGEREPQLKSDVASDNARLREWAGRNESSYAGQVGIQLARGVKATRDEIASLVAALEAAQSAADVPADIGADQERVARKLKFLTLGLAVILVVFVALVLGPITLIVGLVLGVLSVFGWLGASFVTFTRGQRRLFAFLHRRRELAAQVETLRKQLADALEDLKRLTRAYRQYYDWSRAFGKFVHAPLGTPAPEHTPRRLVGRGLPRNVRFGRARPDTSVIEETSLRLRPRLFPVGWASEAWNAFLSDVPAEMGRDAHRVSEDLDLLWVDPAVSRTSMLTTWSDAVESRDRPDGPTEQLQARVRQLVAQEPDLVSRLLAVVEAPSSTTGAASSESYAAFVGQLDDSVTAAGSHSFAQDMFSPSPRSAEPWRVIETVGGTSEQAHLTRTLVVTQFSGGFFPYDLRTTIEESPQLPRDDGPAAERPIL